jgi:hypothetical protein
VLSLKRKLYMYQFSQYAWTHMIILIVVIPTSFFVSNIFEGIIWFILPAFLVVVNDIMAYLAGGDGTGGLLGRRWAWAGCRTLLRASAPPPWPPGLL